MYVLKESSLLRRCPARKRHIPQQTKAAIDIISLPPTKRFYKTTG
jgi:hypothetical protein